FEDWGALLEAGVGWKLPLAAGSVSHRHRWRGPRAGSRHSHRRDVPRSDSEPLDLRLQRRALESKARRSAARTSDDAVRLAERFEDVVAHRALEGLGLKGRVPGYPHAGVERRQLEAGAAREDDRAMDGVLQLADVPGPRMAHEACHDLRHEVAYEKRDVLGPLAERGKV